MASSSNSLALGLTASKLSKLLNPEYAKLAFTLPPSCGSIWSHLIDDIRVAAEEEEGAPCPQNKQEILSFVGRFFSPQVVQRLDDNLDVFSSSWLGLDYTYRHGKALFTQSIVHGIIEEHVQRKGSRLYRFFGVCDGHIQEALQEKLYFIIDTSYVARKASGEGVEGQSKHGWETPKVFKKYNKGGGGGGGSTGGGQVGEGGGSSSSVAPLLNELVETIDVWMPSFTTLKKSRGQKETLAQRSLSFVEHECVDEGAIYDQDILGSVQGDVYLYHGTRTSSLKQFQAEGILPKLRANDFSRGVSFYVSNSIRHAYEHPLHRNPSRKLDPVSIIVFRVDASILHGERPPPYDEKPLEVMWFPESNKEWQEFCINNLQEKGKTHNHDLVFGPICLLFPNMTGAKPLHIPLRNGGRLTQVAFCSDRSRGWLQKCAIKVFCEKRKTLSF